MSTRTVPVPSISCGHCVKTIEREVEALEGVASVSAAEDDRTVTVEWDDDRTDWATIRSLLEEINYPPAE